MKILLILSLLLNLVIITYKRKHKMKNLTLTLNATDIVHAVKSDTYITGQIDKSSDMVKNAALAYNEQAGDESYHTTKIYRTMRGALAKLEASIAEYVETSNPEALITDTLSPELGSFTITISLGDRTSGAFATPMAYIAQEYIINTTLYSWWQPIRPALAKDYLAFANDNIIDIKRCLAKSAPSSGSSSYDDISGEVTPIDYEGSVPEYNRQAEGYFYLRGVVTASGESISNPVVYISNGELAVVETEAGKLWIYNESTGQTETSNISSNTMHTAVQTAAIAGVATYGVTVTASSLAESYDTLDEQMDGYIKKS